MPVLSREIYDAIPYGIGIEVLSLLTWLSVWYNAKKIDFKSLNNDFVILTLVWFIISFLELVNPAGASPRGWLQEIRGTALYPLLIAPLGVILINTKKRLNISLVLLLFFSFLATLNGIKQVKIGPSPGEQAFLNNGGSVTHIVNGQLRAFSYYSNAAQFGPSQAQISIIALVLGIGLKGWFKKIILFLVAILSFYGMLISGTRGAFFVLAVGIFVAIVLSKNIRTIIWGGSISLFLFFILKFTYIGNNNYNIYRLRTAVDPQDASFNVRMINQQKLRDYLATRPFGGGLGVIGFFGHQYNEDKFLSTIEPDSYWVKVWAMYGIVGFIVFFSMWMFVLGKSSAMVWKIEDKNLRVKLISLLAGAAGIFVCSYGNEVMNGMPSLILFQLSIAIVYAMSKQYKCNSVYRK
jgi:O-Antigen ligase.